MKYGYYWVTYGNGSPEIAKLTKNSGWQFFDGRQHKMAKLREIKVLSQIEELEDENQKLRKALELYERERDRFKHTHPEMTGAYFLTGGHGPKDENGVPMYVEICPAYGCGWTYVYQTTGRTISYEGS